MTCAGSTARPEETTAAAALWFKSNSGILSRVKNATISLAYALGLANKLWNPHHPTRRVANRVTCAGEGGGARRTRACSCMMPE